MVAKFYFGSVEMMLSELQSEIAGRLDYQVLSDADWESKIVSRGIHEKYNVDLDHAIQCYIRKISLLRSQVARNNFSTNISKYSVGEFLLIEGRQKIKAEKKIDRLFDKLALCLKEKNLRKNGLVIRNPHNTDYYIDLDAGSDAADGLSTANAWLTINKYTTTTVRSAGDRAFVRANTTRTTTTDINYDEDGSTDASIEIIGADSVTNDPWGDGSDVKPIAFLGPYQSTMTFDDFWKITRIDFRDSSDALGLFYTSSSENVILIDCVFRDGGISTAEGISINSGSSVQAIGCSFSNTNGSAVDVNNARLYLENCTIDAGGGVGSSKGIETTNVGWVEMIDCSIGVTNAFSVYTIDVGKGCVVSGRNTTFGTKNVRVDDGGELFLEDDNGTYLANVYQNQAGTITRDTGTVRSGGASSSAKFEPVSGCGVNRPLRMGNRLRGFARVWASASVQINIEVYATPGSAWDSALTAAECYATFSYYNNGASAARTVVQSTETIANTAAASGWTALTSGNFTPARDGWVYIWFYLEEFEDATEHIFVDIKPVVS